MDSVHDVHQLYGLHGKSSVDACSSLAPTKQPNKAPTKATTKAPTKVPTKAPTKAPTKQPTATPTKKPAMAPTRLLPQLTGLDLYNANSNRKIVTSTQNMTLPLPSSMSYIQPALNVVATFNTSNRINPKVESVIFGFRSNDCYRVETKAPYALCSNRHAGLRHVYRHAFTVTGCFSSTRRGN